ncbi:4-hydroxy-tetrahydrodipicolinate reductase [Salinarimonas soli]|uniref:4-hydroxy-tetrahydrodipicolinate reductase n=1 Tax=Salinarimonas soli TaxID=1638099 RepID=A0A5B2VSG4_9HYPH|nr:4-hydroxy-tetrahydrodipicolinate reductase [Salinarimonas soli]KAA2242161.1 4-hydroxy-tetrahydrodipicolinate reductase [Salinarimonas soli]
MRLVIMGAAGRMGRMLVKAVSETPGCALAAAIEHPESIALGQDAGLLAGCGRLNVPITSDVEIALEGAHGIVDFTTPATSVRLARLAADAGIAHVIGTTGLSDEEIGAIREAGSRTAVVQSGNMSLGVNLLAGLVRKVAQTLGPEFDIEVLEMHHRAKVDAPSGTAFLLGEAAAQGRGVALSDAKTAARDGHTGARREGDIGFAVLRGGSVVGEHTVIFAGAGERIELSHRADDRALFARGALKAALWAKDRPPGFYSMADVLGLNDL